MVYKRLKVLDMAEADDFQGQSKSNINKQPRVAESSFTVSERIEDGEEDMHKGDTSADQLHRKESISNSPCTESRSNLQSIIVTPSITSARTIGINRDNLGSLDVIRKSPLGIVWRISRRVEYGIVAR